VELTAEAQSRISGDRRMQTKQVQVDASNGIVTLSGAAGSDAERIAAAEDTSQIEGVKVVVNNLQVIDASRQRETMPIQQTRVSIATLQGSSKARITSGAKVHHVAPPLDRERQPILRGETAEAIAASHIPAPAARDVVPAGSASSDVHSTDTKAPAGSLIASPDSPQATAAAVAALPPPSEKVTVPYGSVLSVRLLESVNSDLNQPGDNFVASLASAVMVGWGPPGNTRSAETIGGGAGVGAILGAIVGGGKGAAIGAVIGAGVSSTRKSMQSGQSPYTGY